MTNRRDFLKQTSLLVAGGVVGSSVLSGFSGGYGPASKKPPKHIGLVIYSLRDDVKKLGIQKVLEIVAAMGYVNLEVSYGDEKFYDTDPARFKKMVEDLGMKATGAHLNRQQTNDRDADLTWWKKATEAYATAGMKYMVMPSWPISGHDFTLDNVKKAGAYFNEIGLITAGANIPFGYHNHSAEFTNKINNVPVYDLLIANTDPRYMFFQNDVYWTFRGGFNPVTYLKKYPKRINTLHVKDEKAVGVSGTMDFKSIFKQAYSNGIKDWYVEVEEYDGTPQEDVKKSYDFLAKANYVK